jgi:lipid A 3-O-deacylase
MPSQPDCFRFFHLNDRRPKLLAPKFWLAVLLALGCATMLAAQDPPAAASTTPPASLATSPADNGDWVHQSLGQHAIQLGLLAGAGTGLGHSGGTQFGYAGGRGGIILSPEFLPGFLRGNFEWAADVLPMYVVFPPSGAVWGGSIRPVIWQWNFTSAHKFAPYVAAVGGIVFTRENVPPGDTSQVNFTPGIAFGSNVFVKPHRALFVEGSIAHLSSASLGDRNPGYNVNFLFTVGYSWFKGGR